jgi:hypothetical protein
MNSRNGNFTASDLKDRFQSFKDAPLSDLQENVAGEYVKIFSVSEWVHIAFIRTDTETIIETEVSLPKSTCGETLEDSSDQMKLIQAHILYIKNLLENGFTLSIIKEDCLWVASYLTSEDPSLEVFEALVPPIVN